MLHLTMVEMMRGVTAAAETAASCQRRRPSTGWQDRYGQFAHGRVVYRIHTYVCDRVWMGNPEKKENLGNNMTGGHGAVPYFNAFMVPFMKGKPFDTFPSPPSMPSEVRALMERNKREELEKLESCRDCRSAQRSFNLKR
jgi:hypothetical protein